MFDLALVKPVNRLPETCLRYGKGNVMHLTRILGKAGHFRGAGFIGENGD